MLLEFDPYVNEAFFATRAVLVEGDTEVTVIRHLVERMIEQKQISVHAAVHVVNCGTKNNLPLFMRVLGHFRIPHFVIHDLDSTWTSRGKNSAWTLNQTIWTVMEQIRHEGCEVDRYIMERNFESAHGYAESSDEGKPYSAFLQASQWGLSDTSVPSVQALRIALGLDKPAVVFDDEWVAQRETPRPNP